MLAWMRIYGAINQNVIQLSHTASVKNQNTRETWIHQWFFREKKSWLIESKKCEQSPQFLLWNIHLRIPSQWSNFTSAKIKIHQHYRQIDERNFDERSRLILLRCFGLRPFHGWHKCAVCCNVFLLLHSNWNPITLKLIVWQTEIGTSSKWVAIVKWNHNFQWPVFLFQLYLLWNWKIKKKLCST